MDQEPGLPARSDLLGAVICAAMQWRAALAVAGFSAIASTVYLLNDFFDRETRPPRIRAPPHVLSASGPIVAARRLSSAAVVLFAVAVAVVRVFVAGLPRRTWRRTSS